MKLVDKTSVLMTLIPIICLLAITALSVLNMKPALAAAKNDEKKAILVVSFGTTHKDTEQKTIKAVEDKIKSDFPDYEVRRAFTSRIIIKRLFERDGVKIDTEKEALERLKKEGYTEVIVQPLHIVGGEEFEKVNSAVEHFKEISAFGKIAVGRPILYYMGQEEYPDDYEIAIKAVSDRFQKLKANEAVIFMGHGGTHPANAAYAALQLKLWDLEFKNAYVFTVEGYPSLAGVMEKLKAAKIKKVTLVPFMLVAGDHAKNDMAGDDEDSAKSILQKAGFEVAVNIEGLGENPAVQDIYVEHVKDAVAGMRE